MGRLDRRELGGEVASPAPRWSQSREAGQTSQTAVTEAYVRRHAPHGSLARAPAGARRWLTHPPPTQNTSKESTCCQASKAMRREGRRIVLASGRGITEGPSLFR